MFVITLRSSAVKTALLSAVLLSGAIFGTVAVYRQVSAAVWANDSAVSYLAGNAEQRLKFLSQFGWEVEEEPAEVSEIIIPAEFDGAYEEYNQMQKGHGLDLSKYAGLRAKRWTYNVKNYPGYEGESGLVQANIFVLGGVVIGGDICSLEQDGFINDFNFPKAGNVKDASTEIG